LYVNNGFLASSPLCTSIQWHCYISMFMLPYIFVILCGLYEWKYLCVGFSLFFVYIYFVMYVQIIKKVGIAFPACTYFCTYTMQSMTWISICRGIVFLFVAQWYWLEMSSFVDIDGNVDHHCACINLYFAYSFWCGNNWIKTWIFAIGRTTTLFRYSIKTLRDCLKGDLSLSFLVISYLHFRLLFYKLWQVEHPYACLQDCASSNDVTYHQH
jgi:hypothetical protein